MKRKNFTAKLFSLLLALAFALCCLPAAYAAENEITVDFSFYDGDVVIPKTEIAVTDGIAEEYGYTISATDHNGNAVNGITVFDAVVAAHKAFYGDEFTAETAGSYLAFSYGYVTKAFGIPSSAFGMCVNDASPNDGIYNENYGGYTGYAYDTAVIKDGDYVSVYTYSDSWYGDYYITLSDSEIEAEAGEAFTLSATGYSIMYYGFSTPETIASNTYAMAGLDVYSTTDFENYTKIGTLDENGAATLAFDEIGTVYLCISGEFADPDMGKMPVVANWCEVTVTEPKDAIYIPESIDVSFDTETKEDAVIILFAIDYFDLKGEAPDKSECITLEINIGWFNRIIEFIKGAF